MGWKAEFYSQPCENCGYRKKNIIEQYMCKKCRYCCPYEVCYFDESWICICCRDNDWIQKIVNKFNANRNKKVEVS